MTDDEARIEPICNDYRDPIYSERMIMSPDRFHWLHAAGTPTAPSLADVVLLNNEGEAQRSLPAAGVRHAAAGLAAGMRARGWIGERVVLAIADELDFLATMLACMHAGVIAVPAVAPGTVRNNDRLTHFVADSDAVAVLVDAEAQRQLRLRPGAVSFAAAIVEIEAITSKPVENDPVNIAVDSPAYLQYTSGSTKAPKGAIITHRNLATQLQMLQRSLPLGADEALLNPMPLYHDFGLIMSLHAIAHGQRLVLLRGVHAVRDPWRWLSAISHYTVAMTATAPFLLDLCLRRIDPARDDELALDCLRALVVGAEPIPPDVVHTFINRFGNSGLMPEAVLPAYGLAEATLILSSSDAGPVFGRYASDALREGHALPSADGMELIGSGSSCFGTGLQIVSPADKSALPEREIGELWVNAPCISIGYWQNSQATSETMLNELPGKDGYWMRTGDLAFFDQGELFLMGRISDTIIIRGENRYPQDIEWSVGGAHPAVNFGGVVAFPYASGGLERLVVVCEIRRAARRAIDFKQVFGRVRRALVEQQGLTAEAIVLIPQAAMPRTSSGKLARRKARIAWEEGRLNVLAEWRMPVERAETIAEETMLTLCRKVLRASQLGPDDSLFEQGMDSLSAAELVLEIEQRWGIRLDLIDFDENLTARRLESAIEQGQLPGPNRAESIARRLPASGGFSADATARLYGFTASWNAPWKSSNRLAFGVNLDGSKAPLGWCFQSYTEFLALSEWLGSDQPLFGMRSAHFLASYDNPEAISGLASIYLDELADAPGGDMPLRFGGNCQGSVIAVAMVRELVRRGEIPEALYLLENLAGRVDPAPLPVPAALFFGEHSREFNPFLLFHDPQPGLAKLCPADYSIDQIDADHGGYFRMPGVEAFSRALKRRLEFLPRERPGATRAPRLAEPVRAIINTRDAIPSSALPGAVVHLNLEVKNAGPKEWRPEDGLVVGNHWLRDDESVFRWLDGQAPLTTNLAPGASCTIDFAVQSPEIPGTYVLEIDLAEPGVAWFVDRGGIPLRYKIEVQE